MIIKHRLYCRVCKIGKPEIKLVLNKKYGIQYYCCRACNTERAKQYRNTEIGKSKINAAVKKSTEKYLYKQKARYSVRDAVTSGKLIKPNECEKCKAVKVLEGHHFDYSKPLEVIWLCRSCHRDIHNGN